MGSDERVYERQASTSSAECSQVSFAGPNVSRERLLTIRLQLRSKLAFILEATTFPRFESTAR